jgi:hypothetical protein
MATISFDISDEKATELCEIFQLRLNYQGDISTLAKKKQFVQKAIQREMLLLIQAYRNEKAQIAVKQEVVADPEFTENPLDIELKAQQPLQPQA